MNAFHHYALILVCFVCDKCQDEYIPENTNLGAEKPENWDEINGDEAERLGWRVVWKEEKNVWDCFCPKCAAEANW